MEVDEGRKRSETKAVGFLLLPTDLIHSICLRLALPEIPRLRSVSKSFKTLTSDPSFLHHYNFKSSKVPWLFIYTKRWGQDAVLKGITTGSDQWFNFSIKEFLAPIVHRSDDLYFLTACGNVFLFAINTSKEIVSVNLMTKLVEKIPPSPLGPRDTSSWRRSGMKMIPGSGGGGADHFRFFFLEYVENQMFLYDYDSLTRKWRSTFVNEHVARDFTLCTDDTSRNGYIFLTVLNNQGENLTLATGSSDKNYTPLIIVSPSFVHRSRPSVDVEDSSMVVDQMIRIYSDGTMLEGKSSNLIENETTMITVSVELWGCLSSNGAHWEMISALPKKLLMKRPYGVMRGCLERKNGVVRAALMSNYDGFWDIIWLSYEMEKREWTCTLLPDCKMKGGNMGGIAFSSGLTLS
ncbi:hypothetical protein QQ045_021638 [Rhodiola kirilowii]